MDRVFHGIRIPTIAGSSNDAISDETDYMDDETDTGEHVMVDVHNAVDATFEAEKAMEKQTPPLKPVLVRYIC